MEINVSYFWSINQTNKALHDGISQQNVIKICQVQNNTKNLSRWNFDLIFNEIEFLEHN